MKIPDVSRISDEKILTVLHLREVEGFTNSQIMVACKLTKGQVAGIFNRYNNTPEVDCQCQRRENKDGGMEPWWWRK